MNNKSIAAIVLIFCSLNLVQAQSEDEVVKVNVDLVTISVAVSDAKGQLLPKLQADDFVVTDEGKPMRVEFFDYLGPASIVLVVDLSSSMQGDKWRRLKAGMKKFLANAKSGNDYTLIGFCDNPRIIARSVNEAEVWQLMEGLTPEGNTALYDAVLLGLNVLKEIPQRHKALVLFSDGEDSTSRSDLSQVTQQALTHRATIYSVGILSEVGFSARANQVRSAKQLLKELAVGTGGIAHFPAPEEIHRVLEEIRTDLSNRYSLSYYRLEKSPGWRRVQVSLTPVTPRLKLRYQERYLVR